MLGFTGINLPTDPGDIEAVFIGVHPCDLINATTNNPYPTYTREHTDPFLWMQCLPRQVPPGVYNVSVVVGNGVGQAWRHSNSKYYGPGGQLIMLEVYPGEGNTRTAPCTHMQPGLCYVEIITWVSSCQTFNLCSHLPVTPLAENWLLSLGLDLV